MHLLATGAPFGLSQRNSKVSVFAGRPAAPRRDAVDRGGHGGGGADVLRAPEGPRATNLMTRWLDGGCRDWRRETTEDAEEVVVSAVFAAPIQAQKLRVQIAKNVDRWGFIRPGPRQGEFGVHLH